VKATINAGGREVSIECPDANTTATDVAAVALNMWQSTAAPDKQGPAFGLATAERQAAADRFDWRMGEAQPTPIQAAQ
jgi:hypothetical protein